MTEHTIEPELHVPTPRPVRRRASHGSLITFVHFFILPHTLVGLGGIVALLGTLGLATIGKTVDGTVISTSEHKSSKGGRSYPTRLTFTLDGHTEETQQSLQQQPTIGATLPLRVLEVAGTVLYVSNTEGLLFQALFLLVFFSFWNGIIGFTHWNLTFLPLRQKGLVREGVPVIGRVTERKEVRGKRGRISYRLSYDYFIEGLTLRGRMNVRETEALSEGTTVTVLVSERHPNRSVIYRCAPYEATAGF